MLWNEWNLAKSGRKKSFEKYLGKKKLLIIFDVVFSCTFLFQKMRYILYIKSELQEYQNSETFSHSDPE